MCRSLWQTPAALTLISTCVPAGLGVGCSTSFRGALKSTTWKLLMVSLPLFLLLREPCHTGPAGQSLFLHQGMMAGRVLAGRHEAQFRHLACTALIGAWAA